LKNDNQNNQADLAMEKSGSSLGEIAEKSYQIKKWS